MQTDFLAYLLDLKESGSLSKTAQKYYVSYQSVRAGIKNLERLFAVELIRCDNHGCVLTEAGELVRNMLKKFFGKKSFGRSAKTFSEACRL